MEDSGCKRTLSEKLLLTLEDKFNYILHFKNLKLYLRLGLKISKIHRVLTFIQADILNPYITLNTNLRKEATNDFEKDLYKLLNNSIYGKSIEDKRKHLNIKLAVDDQECMRLTKSPLFENFQILNDGLSVMKLKKSCVILDKPIFIGFTVLEYAKNYMYKLYYNHFKLFYKNRIILCYTDTDSFIFLVQTDNIEDDLKNKFGYLMDFSNFPKDHRCFDESHKKEIGFLKLENAEKSISQFVGLKSKLYSMLFNDNTQKRTAKGLNRSVLKNNIDHSHYLDVIDKNNTYLCKMRRIQSREHHLKTIELSKLIFTSFDDKRYIFDDGISTLPFGHYKLNL